MLILDMSVPARGVRLPNLDQRIWNRPSITVQNSSANDDALAQRFARVLRSQIVILFPNPFVPINRSRNLRQRVRQQNQRF